METENLRYEPITALIFLKLSTFNIHVPEPIRLIYKHSIEMKFLPMIGITYTTQI